MLVCPRCKKWEVLDDDLFCSWCKLKLSDFELSLDTQQIYVGDPRLEPLTLTVRHTGASGQVYIKEIVSDQSWLKLSRDLVDLTLRSGGVITTPVEVDPFEMADDYHEALIEAQSNIGPRSVKIDVVPRPEIQVFTGEYTILLDLRQDERSSGYLEVTRGVVTVKSLTTDVPWATVELCDGEQYPCHLDARLNKRLDFSFVIDEEFLISDIGMNRRQPPVEYQGHLILKYVELTIERRESFRVKCFLPPLLNIPEEIGQTVRADVFLGKRKELDVTLQNGERDEAGRADLKIHEVTIDQEWLKPAAPFTYPLVIPSGGYHQLGFALIGDEIGEGIQVAKIALLTNLPGTQPRELYVDVNVLRMQTFPGALAIDFGTTNSCCAVIGEFGETVLIEIDDPADNLKPTTVPTVVGYLDSGDDESRFYGVGRRYYDYSFEPEWEDSIVSQVKRSLGRGEARSISFHNDPKKRTSLVPRDIATDILKRIFEKAEDKLNARIIKCIVSHPSRFSLPQLQDLEAAVLACGVREKDTIQEPVAAALYFIKQPEQVNSYEQYRLMVFDFGGGTTDITLMQVTNDCKEGDIHNVVPSVLGADGNNWFGGEDVTEMVMSVARRKCYDLLKTRYPDASNIVLPLDQKKFERTQYRSLARTNWLDLRRWAEASKIALSNFGDDHPKKVMLESSSDLDLFEVRKSVEQGLKFAVIVDGVVTDASSTDYLPLPHNDIVPTIAELEDLLRPKLEELVTMMKKLVSHHGDLAPDIVLLSGKSSSFPLVERIIREGFPNARIAYPADLKECVVRGACARTSTDPQAGVQILFEKQSISTTTSRLGIRVTEVEQMKFKGFVEAGVSIPAAGLSGPVLGLGHLQRHTVIRFLENTGLRDEWVIDGRKNREIRELGSYEVGDIVSEWETKHQTQISNEDLARARVEFAISPNLNIRLLARIPGLEDPIQFEAEVN